MTNYTPKLGNDLITSAGGFLGGATKWFTRHRGEEDTIATHQGKFRNARLTVEATATVVKRLDWILRKQEMLEADIGWCILALKEDLSLEQQKLMAMYLDEMIGWRYSYGEVLMCAFDGLLGKVFARDIIFFRKAGDTFRNRVICSKTGNRPDIKLGLIPKRLEYGTPDDTLDYKLKNGNWYVAAHSANWMV